MTPVTPLCAQQSRKPTTEISLTCIHSVFSIMQCVSGEKKIVFGIFFFFFKHGQQIKGAGPLLVLSVLFFSLVCLFSLVCFKDLVVESPQATALTVRPTVHLQGAEPPPKSVCCDCGWAVWTEAPGKLVLPSLCFCAASPSGLEVAAWSCHWHVCYCQTVNGSLNHLWFLQLLPSVTWIIVAVLHTYIYIHICLQPVGRGSDLDCVRHPVR